MCKSLTNLWFLLETLIVSGFSFALLKTISKLDFSGLSLSSLSSCSWVRIASFSNVKAYPFLTLLTISLPNVVNLIPSNNSSADMSCKSAFLTVIVCNSFESMSP